MKIWGSIWQRTWGRATINFTRIIALVTVLSLFLSAWPVYAADNLAQLHGTATANPNNASAQSAIDGDVNTHWGSGSTPQDSWLMVDLGSSYYIDGLEIDFTAQSASPYDANVTFGIDGQHFNSWDEATNPPQTWFSPNGFNPDTSPQTNTFIARYVKIEFSSDGGSQDVQIAEFKVYGHASNVTIPVVTTGVVTNIATSTATGNGNITSLGSLNLSDYGICWNTSGNPNCDNDHVVSAGIPGANGPFTVPINSLTQGTTYYVKAYITDGFSFFYGQEAHFTTNCPTSTTISSSVNPSLYGQSVTFTAVVAATGQAEGNPTGNVTFSDGQTSLGSVNLTGGEATYTTSSLSAATHSITVLYNGADYFLTSTSNTLSQVVNQSGASTTTTLTSSLNPANSGQSISFMAVVAATGQGEGTPTGTVTFSEGQTSLGSVSLSGGTAIYTTSSLSAATHSITAEYNGAGNFLTSTSNTLSQVVNQTSTSTTTTLTSSSNPANSGQSISLTAVVVATGQGEGTPTGTVTFSDGQTSLGSVSLSGGTATYTTSSLSAATHSITAVYNGAGNFLTSASNTLSQVVNQTSTSTTTALTSSSNPANSGQSISFTAVVAPSGQGVGTPTGTVTFSDGQTSLGSVGLSGGTAIYTTSQLASGNHTIYATYNADANFSGSTTSLTQNINPPVSVGGGGVVRSSPSYSTSIIFSVTVAPVIENNLSPTPGSTGTSMPGGQSQTGTNQTSSSTAYSGSSSVANINFAVPPGTLAIDSSGKAVTTITVNTVDPASLPLSQFFLPEGTVVLAYDFGPNGTTFSSPITVKCAYDPTTLPSGADQSKIQFALYSPGTGKVTLMPCTVDTSSHTITFSTNHFSYYMLMLPDEANPIIPQPDTSLADVAATKSASSTPDAASSVIPEKNTGETKGPVATTSTPQTPAPPFNFMLWIVIIIIAAVLITLVCILFVRKRYIEQ